MKRPLAWYHLARANELATTASICRVALDRQLFQAPEIEQGAAADRGTAEEIQALARERGWTLPEPKTYEWGLVTGVGPSAPRYTVTLPRIMRVLARDVFELDEFYRECEDEAVASLVAQVLEDRRAVLRSLELKAPSYTVPGAK